MKSLKMLLLVIPLMTFNCTKEGPMGPTGAMGSKGDPGPDAKVYEFNLTFDASTTFGSYTGLIVDKDIDDVVLVYTLNNTYAGTEYWVQLPYVAAGYANIYAEIADSGGMFINTDKADGTSGSPWTSSVTLPFRAVLIKASAAKNIDPSRYSSYLELEQNFNLQ